MKLPRYVAVIKLSTGVKEVIRVNAECFLDAVQSVLEEMCPDAIIISIEDRED